MRLTGLHLLGFKSFADKIELRFGPGVTAIVGPNGSGKSNIVDAVRWLLGEQNSRALRSARVTNLIFAGTEKRKPLGMAQATLVLDNSEQTIPLQYNEINITRRVYRSGESEFLINGTPCRLRDIQQLLLGTGLGRGGMAVVGQGEVDAVLSAQPADRRALLEETAGTSRYRAQQRMAEQRLERARQDLERVNDLTYELTGRVDTLQRQAGAAARYKKITETLHKYRAARAAKDWMTASQRHRAAREQLVAERRQLNQLEQTASQARGLEVQARSALEQSVQTLEAVRVRLRHEEQALAEAAHRVELLRLQKGAVRDRLESANEERIRISDDYERVEAGIARLQEMIELERQTMVKLQRSVEEAAIALEAFNERHRQETSKLETMRADVLVLLQTLAGQRNELQQLESSLALARQRREQLSVSARQLERQLAETKERLDEAKKSALEKEKSLADGRQEERQLAAELRRAAERLAAKQAETESVRARLREVEATRRALEKLEQSHAGYRPAVKAVLQARSSLPGILGTVAQLIDVPARLDVPVQVALGAATQFIVVSDEGAVLQAIEFLRRQRAGRATFLALDALRPRPFPQGVKPVLSASGVVGRAADLVTSEPAVRPVVEYLLGRSVIVEQLPRAQQLARDLPPSVRLVTLQGDLLTPGGPVTGGSRGSAADDGVLARRRELKQLQQRAARLAEELALREQEEQEAAGRVRQLEQTLLQRRSATTDAAIDAANLRQEILRLQEEGERLEAALAENQKEHAALIEKVERDGQQVVMVRQKIQETEGREGSLQQSLQQLTEQLRQAEDERRTIAERLASKRAQLAARAESLKGLQQRQHDDEQELRRLDQRLQRLDELNTAATDEFQRIQAEEAALTDKLPALQTTVDDFREQEAAAAQMVERCRKEQQAAAARVEQANASLAALKEQVWQTEATLARYESTLEGHVQRLRELGIDPETVDDQIAGSDVSRREIRLLEEELEAIGPVHLGAEEELQEIEERVRFLDEQRTDLEQAIESLLQVIERLEKVSQQRFSATLKEVGEQFDLIFRRLFGGGRARLSLSEEDDGVDVHVQMPGKRQQNLLALSGGERALTAIALLFAILRVQPSPFYLLDEIDSALDEANLTRFQRLLREASQDAQFIVITHRATTMEVADTLYGVTAAEPGVSTLISLDLEAAVAAID